MRATAFNQRLLRGQAPSYERLQARLAEDHNAPPSQPQCTATPTRTPPPWPATY